MSKIMACAFISIRAVIVASVIFRTPGALWYSPVLVGKRWQKELGLTEETLKKTNMVVVFGLSFVLSFIMVLGLNYTLRVHSPEIITWQNGLCIILGLAIAGMILAVWE